jgi:drug/metabolite transporter (DMT)-like permease
MARNSSALRVRRASGALAAPALLLATGALLAMTVLISRLAADRGADMLWFLVAVFAGAGIALAGAEGLAGRLAGTARFAPYAAGAGALAAAPSAMGYLSVGHVGAGYVSLAFAFPALLTYLGALALGMDRPAPLKGMAVAAGLTGGAMLAAGKLAAGEAGAGWIALATAMPAVLAAGNLYRSRFWPAGAEPGPLAALTLLCGAGAALPAAFAAEGLPDLGDGVLPLAAFGAAVFAAQYLLLFRLQRLAGPVYLSQIGSVAAVAGAGLAVAALGERLPEAFVPAAVLVGLGLAAFQAERMRSAQGPG